MEIRITRKIWDTDKTPCTLGELSIDGVFQCYTLEDIDRGLRSDMSLKEIAAVKVKHETAIPTGRYQLILSFSNRFKKYLPEILNVPGYAGIRAHSGLRAEHSSGCILVGTAMADSAIQDSKTAMTYLMKKLQAVEKKEKIWVTVE